MAHVELKPHDRGGFQFLIDGHDLTGCVLRTGFSITPDDVGLGMNVSFTVHARTIDLDLPEAVLAVLREDDRGEGDES